MGLSYLLWGGYIIEVVTRHPPMKQTKIQPGTKIDVFNSRGDEVLASGTVIETYWRTVHPSGEEKEEPTEHVRYLREARHGKQLPEGHPDRIVTSCAISCAIERTRQPGRPSEGKQRKNIWYDADVWELIKDLPQGKRGEVLNQVIRENIHRYL